MVFYYLRKSIVNECPPDERRRLADEALAGQYPSVRFAGIALVFYGLGDGLVRCRGRRRAPGRQGRMEAS